MLIVTMYSQVDPVAQYENQDRILHGTVGLHALYFYVTPMPHFCCV